MDDFLNRHSRKTLLIGVVITIIAVFFGMRYAVGMIAGLSFGEIHRRIRANYISNMLSLRKHSPLGAYSSFTLGMVFLCVPLLLGALYPDRINIFTAALGMMLFRFEIFIDEVFFKGKEGGDDSVS
jgi:hypothetical protein